MVTLDEAKKYLRVDFDDEDDFINHLIDTAESLVKDTARVDELTDDTAERIAVLYAIGYLFEHREDADLHNLTLMLRSILFGVREVKF
jgi:uncharacterized phage protein (predicted DNA packaging)